MPIPRAPGLAWLLVVLVAVLSGQTACQVPYAGGARAVSPAQLGAGWSRAAATPVIRQRDRTDCGLAALAMVAGAWGQRWSIEELHRALPPSKRGVKLGALRDLARARGLDAYAIQANAHDLARELAQGRPVLLGLVLPFEQDRIASHYEVAIAFNPSDGSVVTVDPASGRWRQRTRQTLDEEWRPAGFAALVVVGDRRAGR